MTDPWSHYSAWASTRTYFYDANQDLLKVTEWPVHPANASGVTKAKMDLYEFLCANHRALEASPSTADFITFGSAQSLVEQFERLCLTLGDQIEEEHLKLMVRSKKNRGTALQALASGQAMRDYANRLTMSRRFTCSTSTQITRDMIFQDFDRLKQNFHTQASGLMIRSKRFHPTTGGGGDQSERSQIFEQQTCEAVELMKRQLEFVRTGTGMFSGKIKLEGGKLKACVNLQKGDIIFREPLLAFKARKGLFCVNCFKQLVDHQCVETCALCSLALFCSKACTRAAQANGRHLHDLSEGIISSTSGQTQNANLIYQILCWIGLHQLKQLDLLFEPNPTVHLSRQFQMASIVFNSVQPNLPSQFDFALLLDAIHLMHFLLLNHSEQVANSKSSIIKNLYRMLLVLKCNSSGALLVDRLNDCEIGSGLTMFTGLLTLSCEANTIRGFDSRSGMVLYIATSTIEKDAPLLLDWGLNSNEYPFESVKRSNHIMHSYSTVCPCQGSPRARFGKVKSGKLSLNGQVSMQSGLKRILLTRSSQSSHKRPSRNFGANKKFKPN